MGYISIFTEMTNRSISTSIRKFYARRREARSCRGNPDSCGGFAAGDLRLAGCASLAHPTHPRP
jgi:hypothetical protein